MGNRREVPQKTKNRIAICCLLLSRLGVSDPLWPQGPLPCPSLFPRVRPTLCPLNCHVIQQSPFWAYTREKIHNLKIYMYPNVQCNSQGKEVTWTSINRAMDKEVLHVHGILLSHRMDEMPFAATWIQLEIIILSEASPKKTNTIWYLLYVESKIGHK